MKKNDLRTTSHKPEASSPKEWLVPLITAAVVLLAAATPVFRNFDSGLFDIFLSLKPSVPQNRHIVLVDIDDTAIDKLGGWPWPRTYMAQGLELLSEFGAKTAVLDIEYNTPSPPGIDRTYLEKNLKRDFDTGFGDLSGNIADLYSALVTGQIPLHDADSYVNDLITAASQTKDRLYRNSESVAVDNDGFLAGAIGFSGITGTAYRLLPEKNESFSTADRKTLGPKLEFPSDGTAAHADRYTDILPSLVPIMQQGRWAGYVNIEIDPDGKRRRIKPVETLHGKNYAQLVFEPLISWLGNPAVSVSHHRLLLKGARYSDGVHDVSIPLDSSGTMLVHWPKTKYPDSFRHLSFYYLIRYKEQTDELYNNLSALSRRDAWKLLTTNPAEELAAEKDRIDTMLSELQKAPADQGRSDYFEEKNKWFSQIQTFLSSGYDEILNSALSQLEKSVPDPNQQQLIRDEQTGVKKLFDNIRKSFASVSRNRSLLQQQLAGVFCIIGYVGTGTSDLGATPFQKDYPNTGTHACVVNTILQRDFLQEVPGWLPDLLIVLMPLLLFLVIRKRPPIQQNIIGLGFIVLSAAAALVIFLAAGIYVKPAAPVLATAVTFIAYVVMRFMGEAQEKNFLRRAFGVYIADEVIDEIVEDPAKLKLGGENRLMTAMFTDIRGFSTISEQLSAEQLVQLLNQYLSGMSDIILDEKGVVDKYEGDAIIAFWGAPVMQQGHAEHALASALKMKKLESELNKRFLAEKMSPGPLLTRIGINTGDMVAGNMGTQRKMNYTIMGNSVNLAARLEGVNKLYGTWILTTDFTAEGNMDRFVFRKLDRVRVIGIHTPVQLRELVAERNDMAPEQLDFLEQFSQSLDTFERREWKKAEQQFAALSERNPADGPSQLYLNRSRDYLKKPPADSWDGVFNMTQK